MSKFSKSIRHSKTTSGKKPVQYELRGNGITIKKPQKPIIFHALREDDVQQLVDTMKLSGDKEGYFIAPSVGITKQREMAKKFGDVIFLGNRDTIEGMDVYERDVWSPTLMNLPDTLYEWNPDNTAKKWFYEIPELREFIKKNTKEDKFHPIKTVYDMILDEQYLREEIDRVVVENKDKETYKKYYVKNEYGEQAELYSVLQDILEASIKEIPKTRQNMTHWLKEEFGKDVIGGERALFIPSRAKASPRVKPEELMERIEEKLVDYPITTKTLQEKQYEAEKKIRSLKLYDRGMFRDLEEVGNLLTSKRGKITFEEFKKNLQSDIDFYNNEQIRQSKVGLEKKNPKLITLSELDNNLREAYGKDFGLKEWYDELYKIMVEIPSEYFEAKTLDSVPMNKFTTVLIPKNKKHLAKILQDDLKFRGTVKYY